MHDHEIEQELRTIRRAIERLARILDRLVHVILGHPVPPAGGVLVGEFTYSGADMQAILSATPPTTRSDLTALAPADIASITYQKVPNGQTAQTVLQTNTATAGSGLQATDLTYTDTSSTVGDVYTFFVTDTAGNVGALSNAVTATAVTPPVAAPSAGVLSATFQ